MNLRPIPRALYRFLFAPRSEQITAHLLGLFFLAAIGLVLAGFAVAYEACRRFIVVPALATALCLGGCLHCPPMPEARPWPCPPRSCVRPSPDYRSPVPLPETPEDRKTILDADGAAQDTLDKCEADTAAGKAARP